MRRKFVLFACYQTELICQQLRNDIQENIQTRGIWLLLGKKRRKRGEKGRNYTAADWKEVKAIHRYRFVEW